MKSTIVAPQAEANWLLGALPSAAYERVSDLCEMVETTIPQTIWDSGTVIDHVYFPQSGCLSVVSVVESGQQVEVGTVGWEGMTGLSLLHGINKSATRCIVQLDGIAKRIRSTDFVRELAANEELLGIMHRYAQYWSEQSGRSIACNAVHTIEQRCARWLLMTQDRFEGDVMPLRHEFLAIMLGVRRASVSVAAASLQERGLISYSRGKVRVIDRPGLIKVSCGCYQAIRANYSALLPAGRNAVGAR